MPSIKEKFYGIIRQFSSNTVVVGGSEDDGDEVAGLSASGDNSSSNVISSHEQSSSNSVVLTNHHSIVVEGGDNGSRYHAGRAGGGGRFFNDLSGLFIQKSLSLSTANDTATSLSATNNHRPKSVCSPSPSVEHSFIHRYLAGRLKSPRHPEIYYGKTGVDLPVLHLRPLSAALSAAHSGPDGGLTKVPPVRKRPMANIANLDDELNLSFDAESLSSDTRVDTRASSSGCLSSLSATNLHSLASPTYLTNGRKYNLADSVNSISSDHEYNGDIDWSNFTQRACGLSTSLYECNPITKVPAGNPVADVFAVCARRNSCVLALADGVNWGEKSRLAARCSIRGAVEHLNDTLYSSQREIRTTLDVFHCLLGAFHAGHHLILQEGGALTTLCVVVVCPLKDAVHWVACACNVGDSLAFVFNQTMGVRELTLGSHDIQQMRDMRDAGGALGPVDGVNPELNNMTCSMSVVDPGDIVFITSDGISDNFDPVVGKFCLIRNTSHDPPPAQSSTAPAAINVVATAVKGGTTTANPSAGLTTLKSPSAERRQPRRGSEDADCKKLITNGNHRKVGSLDCDDVSKSANNLPVVEAYQRHELMLLRMDDLLRHGVTVGDPSAQSAKDLCENLVNFATQLTMAKRRTLEDPDLYNQSESKISRSDQRYRRKMVRQKIADMPGKLDHATVVAYCVGELPEMTSSPNPPDDSAATTPEYEESGYLITQRSESTEKAVFPDDDFNELETPTPRRHCVTAAKSLHYVENEYELCRHGNDEEDASVIVLADVSVEKISIDLNSSSKCNNDEFSLNEFFDATSEQLTASKYDDIDDDKYDEQDGTKNPKANVTPLSTIHEASANRESMNHRVLVNSASMDSDTLLVVFTSDSHTTVPSSEMDSCAVSPPSVIEMRLNLSKNSKTDESVDVSYELLRNLETCQDATGVDVTLATNARERESLCCLATTPDSVGGGIDNNCFATSSTDDVIRPVKGRTRGECQSADGDTTPFSRMLNQSYYLATSQERNGLLGATTRATEIENSKPHDHGHASNAESPLIPVQHCQSFSTNAKQPGTRFKRLSKTWERFERAVPFRKPKKHSRGSPQRHTVAVDSAQWEDYKKQDTSKRYFPAASSGRKQQQHPPPSSTVATPGGGDEPPVSPKRTPSLNLHIPWSPIRSLKFFKSLTSPRHHNALAKQSSLNHADVVGACPNNQQQVTHTSKPAGAENLHKTSSNADEPGCSNEAFQVSHSTSDSHISHSNNCRLESLV